MITRLTRHAKAPAILLAGALCFGALPPVVCAQSETVQSSRAQDELNERGVEAIIAGNYDAAIRLFKSSLDIGPLNITQLNLGRAYQKANQCESALAAYNAVAASPAVGAPSPDEISAAVEKYRAELASTCSGFVVMECSVNMMVSIDGAEPVPCSSEKVTLPPGDHRFEGSVGARHVRAGVTVVGMKTSRVALDLGPEPSSNLTTWAFVTAGAGGVLLLTALAVDVAVVGPLVDDVDAASKGADETKFNALRDDLDTQQSLGLALYVGGGMLAATGVVLFLLAPSSSDGEPVSALPVNVWLSPDRVGVQTELTW